MAEFREQREAAEAVARHNIPSSINCIPEEHREEIRVSDRIENEIFRVAKDPDPVPLHEMSMKEQEQRFESHKKALRQTRVLREAILEAATAYGSDGQGKDGLVGYLFKIADEDLKAFTTLLGKLLPLQISADPASARPYRSSEEIMAELQQRGVKVVVSVDQGPPTIDHVNAETVGPDGRRLN